MVRSVVEVAACDICGSEDRVVCFAMRESTDIEVDLCDEHAGPIREVMQHGRPANAKKPPRKGGRQAQHSITPLD